MVGENLREHQTSLAKTAFPEIPICALTEALGRKGIGPVFSQRAPGRAGSAVHTP